VSKAVAHRTVEEVWYIVSGRGRIWRKLGEQEEIAELAPGTSLTIPTGTHFQFRCDGYQPLNAIGATMPPWPGENEAFFVDGAWQPTVLKGSAEQISDYPVLVEARDMRAPAGSFNKSSPDPNGRR
jgi:hypothetical protein